MTLAEAFETWQFRYLTQFPNTKNWFQTHKQEVQVIGLSEWTHHSPEIVEFARLFNPRQNECYKNAYECAKQVSGVGYVEGIVKANILNGSNTQYTNHAWNSFENSYFDLTPISTTSQITNPYLQLLKIDHPGIPEVERFIANGYFSFCIPYIKFQVNE